MNNNKIVRYIFPRFFVVWIKKNPKGPLPQDKLLRYEVSDVTNDHVYVPIWRVQNPALFLSMIYHWDCNTMDATYGGGPAYTS